MPNFKRFSFLANRIFPIAAIIAFTWIVSLFALRVPPPSKEDTFCTLEDELYQSIESQYEGWIEYYRSRLASTGFTSSEIVFYLKNGQGYSVNASIWRSDQDMPRFFVVAETGWQERFGVKGYFFSPIGKPSVSRLRFQYLHGDTYCYWFE